MTTPTCKQWGHTSAPQKNNPTCDCLMCERHRHTLNNLKTPKRKARK